MPSKSDQQKKFMAIAAHDPQFAKEHEIDPKVAKEFNEADQKKDHAGKKKKVAQEGLPSSRW